MPQSVKTRKRIGSVWYNDQHIAKLCDADHVHIRGMDDLYSCDAIVFWGGEDISPSLYGEKSVHSHAGNKPSERDKFERLIFNEAEQAVPMIGICRGAQLICALTGGKLWQHVENHGRDHNMRILEDGSVIQTNSLHHQMMRLTPDYEILAVSELVLSPVKKNQFGAFDDNGPEVEVAFHPKTKSLLIQGHPEYPSAGPDFLRFVRSSINKYLGV